MSCLQFKLHGLMQNEKLTATKLARLTGIKQPVIHRILNGDTSDPKIGTVAALAKYFRVSINELIGDESSIITKLPFLTLENIYGYLKGKVGAEKYFKTSAEINEDCIAIEIVDSTMRPRFSENTIIIIDPSVDAKNRDYAVVYVENKNKSYFRQILLDGKDTYLKPLNNDFPMIHLTSKFQIIGVVIKAEINFKEG